MSKGTAIFLSILLLLFVALVNTAINGFIVWIAWDVVLVRIVHTIQPISFWLCCLIGFMVSFIFHPFKASAKFS
jgi:hypothetical protein